jgi:hypothetical protein
MPYHTIETALPKVTSPYVMTGRRRHDSNTEFH